MKPYNDNQKNQAGTYMQEQLIENVIDAAKSQKEQMNIVVAGHVDHGKSTVVGRLMADTNSLPDGKIEQIKRMCELNAKPFEYAFLLDALKDERSQGITIDSARVFFKTEKRDYIIIDAPGHIEFLKNMVSGASRAEAALLVIDASEGIQENSKRHGYMLSMLGIRKIAVIVNKMDLVDYNKNVFEKITTEYTAFLKNLNITPLQYIPISGTKGDNITSLSSNTEWYKEHTVLSILDSFDKEKPNLDKPFRMPVQDVYKFTRMNDNRRIVAGQIESGKVKIGDEVIFYPSGKKSKIKTIESFNTPVQKEAVTGQNTGFTLEEQIYISRGEIAVKTTELKTQVARRIKVNLFWLGKKPFIKKKDYFLKLGTDKVKVRLEQIINVLNASNLELRETQEMVNRHDVAECVLYLNKAIAFDKNEDIAVTSRFVIIDEYEIAGGGIILAGMEDKLSWVRDKVILRNYKWQKSQITTEKRAEKYNQKATLVLITGTRGAGKKEIARELEAKLFSHGKVVYFLGIGSVIYGIDADLNASEKLLHREEHLRRLSEVIHILLDAGTIAVVTAIELNQDDLEIIKTTVDPDKIEVVWVGEDITTDIAFDLKVPGKLDIEESVTKINNLLYDKGIIFKPW